MEFEPFTHLTFDCYGTLIDWESGILAAVLPVLSRKGVTPSEERLLKLYTQFEAEEEAGPYKSYRAILCAVSERIGEALGVSLSWEDRQVLPDSVGEWPPFEDTVASLHRLQARYRLAILSNIDDAMFARTQARLGVDFQAVITAEQVRSYKPGAPHFEEALSRLSVPKEQILHVAQSLYHDHVPAKSMGFRTAWIDRLSRLPGQGLAPQADVRPDLIVRDLSGFTDLACSEYRPVPIDEAT